jgi:hypothetical protein
MHHFRSFIAILFLMIAIVTMYYMISLLWN